MQKPSEEEIRLNEEYEASGLTSAEFSSQKNMTIWRFRNIRRKVMSQRNETDQSHGFVAVVTKEDLVTVLVGPKRLEIRMSRKDLLSLVEEIL